MLKPLESRQEEVLRQLVELHIRTAEPVASKVLSESEELGVSPATIRCEMASLEKNGYIRQPHTSSGRVPTEKGYQYYLQHLSGTELSSSIELSKKPQHIEAILDTETVIKTLAKMLVEVSGEMVVVALDKNWSYYTGVSNLLSKPDFQDVETLQTISSLVDHFDEVLAGLFHIVTDNPEVRIGSQNPFGEGMTSIIIRYTNPDKSPGLLGIVGPLRMDYTRNLRLVREAKEILDQSNIL